MNGKTRLLFNKKFKNFLWHLTSEVGKMTVKRN